MESQGLSASRLNELLGRFQKLRALVVGDVCLDRWCTYDPALSEPSRETGLTRVAVVRTETTAGAAGTVANNLAALGAGRVAVLGLLGDDGHGYELRRALECRNIDTSLLQTASTPTFTYTKLINQNTLEEDLGRVDFLPARQAAGEDFAEIFDRVAEDFDVVLISDQAETEHESTITAGLREKLAALAARNTGRVLWVDSRMRAEKFRGVLVKPNEREAREACQRAFGRTDYQALRRHIGHPALIVTHAERGALVLTDREETWVPTPVGPPPVDVCGAGDSFSAAASLSLGAGATAVEAAYLGNLTASITIMQRGTGTASPAEVQAALEQASWSCP